MQRLVSVRLPSAWLLRWAVGLLLVAVLCACGKGSDREAIDLTDVATTAEIAAASGGRVDSVAEYLFGFDLRNGPREDARQYLPLLAYLDRNTGDRFRLHFTQDAGNLLDELAAGRLHFAAIGAGTYLTAESDGKILPLVRGVNAAGESGYRSIIVVRVDSRMQTLQDLKGTRLAFGSATSTQGHWIPRIMLHKAGMSLADFTGYRFTGSHRDCAEAVISGEADGCGLQDTLAKRLVESGSVRALAVSEAFPSSGIFASAGVPAKIRARVREAMVAFDPRGRDQDGLYHWERTEMAGGFAPASIDDYAELRDQATRLGLLPQPPGSVESP